jgi:hypothetical protein
MTKHTHPRTMTEMTDTQTHIVNLLYIVNIALLHDSLLLIYLANLL